MSPKHDARLPLAFIPPGTEVRLAGFGDEIDALQREQLTAYGLAESRTLKVLQQRPMTVILVDEVELASNTRSPGISGWSGKPARNNFAVRQPEVAACTLVHWPCPAPIAIIARQMLSRSTLCLGNWS